MVKCEKILRDGGVLCVFPEGRLPKPGEERPLPFKPGAAYLALSTGVPVIPVYTNGSYFKKKRAEVMIGTPIYPRDHIQSDKSDKENTEILSAVMRERLLILEKSFEERTKQK